MKVLIIEDEPATARRLEKILREIEPDTEVLDVIDTVEDSISFFLKEESPQLVFMDIHLADGNSFEIFEKARVKSPVIFTTAYDEYAIKAFKVNSIDYLLKPIKKEELSNSLRKFRNLSMPAIPDYHSLLQLLRKEKPTYLQRFVVKIGQVIKTIDLPEIAYFLVENSNVYAILQSGKRYLIDYTLEHLDQQLDPGQFFRINRSMIISYTSISGMIAYSKSRIKIELSPPYPKDVITSTDRSADFKSWLSGNK
jgi:DNA-binding LytR/AlgR family response regulator